MLSQSRVVVLKWALIAKWGITVGLDILDKLNA